jgi:hypothetical protein
MSPRAAQVRIYVDYVDADVLRRGKILADLRGDVTYPGAPEPSSTSDSGRTSRTTMTSITLG